MAEDTTSKKVAKIDSFVDSLWMSGDNVVTFKDMAKIKEHFDLACRECKGGDVRFLGQVDIDNYGGCDTCGPDPSTVDIIIKCADCGKAFCIHADTY